MGYMRHHAIIVTSFGEDWLVPAHQKATAIFPIVSPILESGMNYYLSFLIPCDGSKEGWSASDEGDERRDRFINWLRDQEYDDGSSCLTWAEVQYGDEDGEQVVLRHSN